jgi:hypothetical protein
VLVLGNFSAPRKPLLLNLHLVVKILLELLSLNLLLNVDVQEVGQLVKKREAGQE